MNIKKKELIISVIMIVVFVVLGFNFSVLAVNTNAGFSNITLTSPNNSINSTNMIEVVNGTNSIQVTNTNTNPIVNTNTNTPSQLANTGLEDLPWLVIGLCVVSAVFAYNKIREYKSI